MPNSRTLKIRFDVIGLVGIVVGAAGLYTYYKGTKPRLDVVIDSITNVVDVNERVAGLGVIFNGEDLLKQQKVLTIYAVTLRNSGNESLRKDDFDEDALVGIKVGGATVLSAQLDRSRTSGEDYVRRNAKFVLIPPNIVQLNPIIVDPGDTIGLRIVAIHSSTVEPAIASIGKVVGQKTIPVNLGRESEERGSIWSRAFSGGIGVNLLRLPIFFFGFFLVLIAAIGVPLSFSEWVDKRRRRRVVNDYFAANHESAALTEFSKQYIDTGAQPLQWLVHVAANPQAAEEERLRQVRRISRSVDMHSPPGVLIQRDGVSPSGLGRRSGLLSTNAQGEISVNALALDELNGFLDFLRKKGDLPERNNSVDGETDPGE